VAGEILLHLEVERAGRTIVAKCPPDEDQDTSKVDLDATEAVFQAARMGGSTCRCFATELGRPAVDVDKSKFRIVRPHYSLLRC
jgi:hypothetical protein